MDNNEKYMQMAIDLAVENVKNGRPLWCGYRKGWQGPGYGR